jgi:methyltransferase
VLQGPESGGDVIVQGALLAFVTVERLIELVVARRNTAALKAKGAYEVGAGHYPVIVILHGAWILGLWLLALDRPIIWPWLIAFFAGEALRAWVMLTLKGRWTTRIIVIPDAPLVEGGPYRFFAHPNYVAVVVEFVALPMAFGLAWFAAIFSGFNALMLLVRVRSEDAALFHASEA